MLGGYLHRRGWKQDRAQKPTVRGLDQLLSPGSVSHTTRREDTRPSSRRNRKAMGPQSACKGSKTPRLTVAQGTRFYSGFSQALPGEAGHFSRSMLTTEDLRHTSVSCDQQGDLRSPVSGPKDDIQQLPPS